MRIKVRSIEPQTYVVKDNISVSDYFLVDWHLANWPVGTLLAVRKRYATIIPDAPHPTRTYKTGTRFMRCEYQEEYILAQVDYSKVALVSLSSGNRWADPVQVESGSRITESEISQCGIAHFEEITKTNV